MQNPFKGISVVIPTPFTASDEVDEDALRAHISFLIESGVHAIMPTGSTGEFTALAEEEIQNVLKITVDEAAGRIPVIAGAAAVSTAHTIARCQFAKDNGASGVLVVSPYYCHPGDEEIYGHFKALSDSVDIPIMLYNNPGTSGVDILPELAARIGQLDNIVCMKESSGDMTRVCDIMRRVGDKMDIFCGCDTLAMEMFLVGAVGWVAPPANVVPKLCVELYELAAVQKDIEKAKALYFKMLPLFHLFEATGQYIQLVKAGLEVLGRPVGIPRKPLLPASKEHTAAIEAILKSLA